MTTVLPLRALNRATLARQRLLARGTTLADVLAGVGGLQAQAPFPPFVGLWSRVADFASDHLRAALDARAVVRATLQRATLHVVTADDFVRFRAALQPVLTRAWMSASRGRAAAIDLEALVREAKARLRAGACTAAALRDHLGALHPGLDPQVLSLAVRHELPMVQTPGRGAWSFPASPAFADAEAWLGRPLGGDRDLAPLLRRYLEAFGPATVADFQTWSGVRGARPLFEGLRPELEVIRDEHGRELFDVEGAPRPDVDTPAPPRFVPDWDNLLLAHDDRTRIIPPEHRPTIFFSAQRVRATVLVDGFAAAVWDIERSRDAVVLVVRPLAPMSGRARNDVADEGARLLAFTDPGARTRDVRFDAAP